MRWVTRWIAAGMVLLGLVVSGCGGTPVSVQSVQPVRPVPSLPPASHSPAPSASKPLAGRVVVIDPGHQLGNGHYPSQINRQVPDGAGGTKACNTTGTATRAGFPEATFAWNVAVELKKRLESLGARVVMTRTENSAALWGPCVDVRGRAGDGLEGDLAGPRPADLKISLHGDGSYAAGAHGFHVIYRAAGSAPSASSAFAVVVRDALVAASFVPATYVGSHGLDQRSDLATLNLSTIPTVLVEAGNMKDPGDAAVMSTTDGQRRLAAALAEGILAQLTHM